MAAINEQGWNKRQRELVTVAAVYMAISTLVVGMRLLSRRLFRAKLWWDDYLAIAALVINIGVNRGLGRHIQELQPAEVVSILKAFYPLQITWTVGFGLTSCCVLALYIRVFPNTWLYQWSYYLGIFIFLFDISAVGILIWQCTPIAYFWDKSIPGHCINQNATYVGTSCIVVLTVLTLFLLLLPIIWRLHTTKSRKLALFLTFAVGTFVVVTSIIRIAYLAKLDDDATWSSAPIQVWSGLENVAGIISACIPSIMPLVLWVIGRKARPQDRRASYFNRSSSGSKSKSKSSSRITGFSSLDENTQSTNLEDVELSTANLNQGKGDSERLEDDGKHTITMTNQLAQTDEISPLALPDCEEDGSTFTWGLRAPMSSED